MFFKILAFVLLASCHAQWNNKQEHGDAVLFTTQSLDYNEHGDGFKNDYINNDAHNYYADAAPVYSKASAPVIYAKSHNQEPSYINQEYQTYHSGYDISSEDSGNYQKQQPGDNGNANFNRFTIHKTGGDGKVEKYIVVDKLKQNTQATKSEQGGFEENYQYQDTPVYYNNPQDQYHY